MRSGSFQVRPKKKLMLSERSIRFKDIVEYRFYDSQDVLFEIPSDAENATYSNYAVVFLEGKERIKNSRAGCGIIQKFLRNLRSKIKSIVFRFATRKKGALELFYDLIFGRSQKLKFRNIPWESTVLLEENQMIKDKNRGKFSQFLNDFSCYSGKQFKNTINMLHRHTQRLKIRISESIRYFATGIYGFAQKICSRFKTKLKNYISTIRNIYTSTTSIIKQMFSIIQYLILITYPYALYFYLRMKKQSWRRLVLAFHVIRRIVTWKKSVRISDLPVEIHWEIVKHLDYKSASRFCKVMNICEFDCLQYHQFFIHPPVKAQNYGIINFVFTMIGWLFYQPQEEPSTEVDIWSVSYILEKMIGKNEEKFSILVRNEKFRQYVGDEIVLALACKYGQRSIFCQLITDSNNDPSIGMDFAIRWAAYKGEAEIIKLLLKDDRVNPSIDNNKPFISACEHGHVDAVDALLTHSAVDPASQSNYAIEKACYNGHEGVVRRLLKDPRVDPTASRNYCLKLACKRNHIGVVQILLSDSRIRPGEEDYKFIRRLLQRQNKIKYSITA